jgi:hypothetical protein
MPDTDILEHSVTKSDYALSPQGGAFYLNISNWPQTYALPPSLDNRSMRESDALTISTLDQEAIWAGAVAIAITKVSSLSWEVTGDIPLRTRRGQDLLLNADAGRGWVSFISKLLQDFLLTSNGCFIEVVRAADGEASPIIGLIPLDSMRCTRTGNAETPVIYQDLKGQLHELKYYEVLEFADMPSTRASMFGSGKCAAARAYKSIYKLACIEQYISEKVSGRNPSTLELIRGLNDPQLKSVLTTAQSEADARGVIAYMGAILATIPGDGAISNASIPLKGFPDNFDRQKELDISVIAYANNLGLDVQDLQPLTGRALGTGAQSQVLDEKAKGKGLSAFRQQFVHAINQWVLPDSTTMEFIEHDWRDKKLRAENNSAIETYVGDSVNKGIITAPQGLQILVDENVYDKALLPSDLTPDLTLADDEKPDMGEGQAPVADIPITIPTVKELIKDFQEEIKNA